MATDNKQKVLIRSMSVEELMDYLCTSDLNGKITPKNEDTWHQKYDSLSQSFGYYWKIYAGIILTNESKTNKNKLFHIKANNNFMLFNKTDDLVTVETGTIRTISLFRPLIEYKE